MIKWKVIAGLAATAWTAFVAYRIIELLNENYADPNFHIRWDQTFSVWFAGLAAIVVVTWFISFIVRSGNTLGLPQRYILAIGTPSVMFWIGYGVIHEFVHSPVDEWDDTWWAWATLTIAVVMFEYWLFEPRSPQKPLSGGER